jgi:spore coat protein H
VPAPRTSFARVQWTAAPAPQEFLGLYTIVEEVDKKFLKENFGAAKGLLLKPERMRGLEYLGEDWPAYADKYVPKTEATAKERQRLIEFARLIDRESDEAFAANIKTFMDVDAFLRFLAVHSILVSMDSFIGLGHNYYVYLHPETQLFHFIPWDLNHALAGLQMFGRSDQLLNLSISHPHTGKIALIDRLLAMPGMAERFRRHTIEVHGKTLSSDAFRQRIKNMTAAAAPILEDENRANTRNGVNMAKLSLFAAPPGIDTFLEKRTQSVDEQLLGTTTGFVPGVSGSTGKKQAEAPMRPSKP